MKKILGEGLALLALLVLCAGTAAVVMWALFILQGLRGAP